jgi:hydrogenase maturation factor
VDVSGVQREVSLECVVDDYFPLEKCVGHWPWSMLASP